MAKRFLKSTETRDELQLPAVLCQDARQRLMLHPYITASRTIINIVLLKTMLFRFSGKKVNEAELMD